MRSSMIYRKRKQCYEYRNNSEKIGASWAQKRKLAREGRAVIIGHCPSWLRQTEDEKGFESMPERVKLVHRVRAKQEPSHANLERN